MNKMDNLTSLDISQLEKDPNNEKTVNKRRSSVFYSRATTFDDCEGTQRAEKLDDHEDAAKLAAKLAEEETFRLEEYVRRLRDERKDWVETLKQRKAQRRNLAKQKLHLESQGQVFDVNIFGETERAFIAARPNYQNIYRNYRNLSDTAVKMSVLHNMVCKLNRRFISQMESKLGRVTDKLIEISGS